jgi:15-hydroxyprostaglandin dehydrogenase (NAD)
MGNGVANDLAKKGWKVVIVDFNASIGQQAADSIKGDFYHTDVRSWEQQYDAFEKTFEKYGRLDFGTSLASQIFHSPSNINIPVFGNAGRADAMDYFDSKENATLTRDSAPDLSVLDICLVGASYTALLALRYFLRNPPQAKGGVLVLTSSGAGLYPTPVQPFYAAAKHGVLGLARSMGQRHDGEGIRVCGLVPGLVPTTIMPKEILDRTDKELITPVSHIVTAINDILNSDRNATVCEASVDQLFYRDPPEFPDVAQRRVILEVSRGMGGDFANVREKKQET